MEFGIFIILAAVIIIILALACVILAMGGAETYSAIPITQEVSNVGWFVELWDTNGGRRIPIRFRGGVKLGRGIPGRWNTASFPVSADVTVSSEQALLCEVNNMLLIWNMGRTNPTVLNGLVLDEPQVLQIGDRIDMGRVSFLVAAIQRI